MLKNSKSYRLLEISNRLLQGECLDKKMLADIYDVDTKSIQRDIDDIRSYLVDKRDEYQYGELVYDYSKKGYLLKNNDKSVLTNEMILSISKIIMESRAFVTEELDDIISILLKGLSSDSKRLVNNIILNQKFHYKSPSHGKPLFKIISDLSAHISRKEKIEIHYTRADGKFRERVIKPFALVFSEYYFYLIADIDDTIYKHPVIFRVDRIDKIINIGENFKVATADRFEDGEYIQKVQFMYAGFLQKVKFEYYGNDPGVVLDRIPSSSYVTNDSGVYCFEAEVSGDGIIMWLLSQGSNVRVTSPERLIKKMKLHLEKVNDYYK